MVTNNYKYIEKREFSGRQIISHNSSIPACWGDGRFSSRQACLPGRRRSTSGQVGNSHIIFYKSFSPTRRSFLQKTQYTKTIKIKQQFAFIIPIKLNVNIVWVYLIFDYFLNNWGITFLLNFDKIHAWATFNFDHHTFFRMKQLFRNDLTSGFLNFY